MASAELRVLSFHERGRKKVSRTERHNSAGRFRLYLFTGASSMKKPRGPEELPISWLSEPVVSFPSACRPIPVGSCARSIARHKFIEAVKSTAIGAIFHAGER
jgi:hypothetical protein